MNKKIVLVTNNFPPIICGVGDYTYYLAQEFRKNGHDVYIICKQDAAIIAQKQENVYAIVPKWNWNGCKRTLNKIKEIKPDWVFLQYVPYAFHKKGLPLQFLFFVKILKEKTKVLTFFHEIRIKINYWSLKSIIYGSIMYVISNLLSKFSNVSITSNDFYTSLLKDSSKKISIIRVGSNIPTTPVDTNLLQSLRTQLSIKSKFIIGVFGMNLRVIATLFEALKILNNKAINVGLLIIGKLSPENIQKIKALATNHDICNVVYIKGETLREDVFQYLKLMDIYAMLEPTHSLNTWTGTSSRSGTLAAALSAGLPIIGTQGELNDDFINNSKIQLIDDSNNAEKLATVIHSLLKAENLKELGKASLSLYEKELTWQSIFSQYYALTFYANSKINGKGERNQY